MHYRLKRRWHNITFVLVIACTLFTCIDPYTPDLKSFESRLVIDALVTDEAKSNYVILTRTIETSDEDPVRVTGATVIISDDLGNRTLLVERNPGEYRTDSLTFRGATGRTYTLGIETEKGEKYESAPSFMYSVTDIDSIYFSKDQLLSEEKGEMVPGVSIFIDSRDESNSNYYRWSYEEWWKFQAPEPKMFNYINDSTIVPVAELKLTCWANKKSDVIDIENTVLENNGGFIKKPVLFIASEETNRLLIQYYVEVRQLSISKDEYRFWDLMLQLNESGGDIFDKQPFQIFSNVHNVTNPDEQIIGYFQVSAAKLIHKYITFNEIASLDLPFYMYDCERIEKGEVDYPPPGMGKGYTFNDINAGFLESGYTFIKPVYRDSGELYRLVFTRPFCAECTVNGSMTKPYFWVDIE
ncbi:MAG: DUF4249 domain-containing protein [Bacteroidales bacterium]